MQTSEAINEIAAALAKAQGAIQPAAKDASNPHFKTKYADLASIWDACRKALTDNAIAVVQAPSTTDDGAVMVTTRLVHASGQWMETRMACRPMKADAQGMGSVTTYLRRYSLAAMAGVAPEEDDGEAAAGRGANGGQEMPPAAPQSRQTPARVPPKVPQAARPPLDEAKGDPLPIPDADGDVQVLYTDSRGGEHHLASAVAYAKIETAHRSTISDAALDDLIRKNRPWLATHYAAGLKVFEKEPRPQAVE